jgi:Ca2+-binding RTX toxin-like protein
MPMRGRIGCAIGAVLLLSLSLGASAHGASPTCAEGPEVVGKTTILGTPCDDLIVAPARIEAVQGGAGDDTIMPAATLAEVSCPDGCHLDIGSQTFEGGAGDDVVYGERGNDRLFGGTDTLSYSTGVTPGFFNNHAADFSVPGFPPLNGERGVYVDLSSGEGDNGTAPFGGGTDSIEAGDFEVVIGTAFSDYIVGGGAGETIFGGGGGDVIRGGEGDDTLFGGADGDDLDGGPGADGLNGGAGSDHCASASTETSCESAVNTGGVVPRDQSKVAVGFLAPEDSRYAQLYLAGSGLADEVTVTYTVGPPQSVLFTLGPGSTAPFDSGSAASAGCNPPGATQLLCPLSMPLDSLVVAGLGGDDTLDADGLPSSASLVLAGGEEGDTLAGGELSEDVLADGPDLTGPGEDMLSALGGDDALLNNGGFDRLFGGSGNDLFLSDALCEGDALDGGEERDNASWTKFKESGVAANLGSGTAGAPGAGGVPTCPGGSLGALGAIEDLEGTSLGDFFTGDGAENQLLGWAGPDTYSAGAGKDRILANSGDVDPLIACGSDFDVALIDRRETAVETAEPDCENVQPADVNVFRVETELEVPPVTEPPPAGSPPSTGSPPRGGRTAPVPSAGIVAPGAGGRERLPACLAGPSPRRLRCAEKPPRVDLRPLALLERVHWRAWGLRRAVGFGRLAASERCCALRVGAPAKLIASGPRTCGARRWYTRLTVLHGRGFRQALVRRAGGRTPCD